MTRDGGSGGGRPNTRGPRAALTAASRARPVVALAVLAGALLSAAPARAQFEAERTVRRVEVHGNRSVGEGTLKKLLRTRGRGGFPFFRSRPLRPDYIRFDRLTIQDWYRRHGFLEARVDSVPLRFDEKETAAEVHFYVTEGPRSYVRSVRFESTGPVPEARLRDVLELKPGEPLDIPEQDQSREAVHDEYTERGYVAAVVRDSLEADSGGVRIVYRITPGPETRLDSVHVEGTAVTKPAFVSREVVIDRGDVLRRSRLLRSQQRIYDTGFYSDVRFDRSEIDSARTADVIIDVRERKMGWVDVGVGYGTVDQLRLTSQVGQRNLWRDGVRLVATGLLGVRVRDATEGAVHFPYFKFHPKKLRLGDSRIDVSLTRPWNFGLRVAATVGGYAEHVRPVGANEDFPPYRAYGGSGALAYDFTRQTHSRFSYEHRRVVSDTTNLLSTGGVPIEDYTINRVIASLERDTRDNPFDPRSGLDLLGTSSFVGGALSGSAQFVKHTGTGMKFVPINAATVAAFRVRVGLINPQAAERAAPGASRTPINLIPLEERFFLGGANTVRGYGENEIGSRVLVDPANFNHRLIDPATEQWFPPFRVGGRVLVLLNAEIRRRLFGPFGVEAFLDGGNVWERPTDIHLRNLLSFADRAGYNDMRYGVGVGLRVGTPIGPLRFDYGWKVRLPNREEPDATPGPGEFHFSVGQAF